MRNQRRRHSLSQHQLSDVTGVVLTSVVIAENGKEVMTEILAKLFDALGLILGVQKID